MGGMATKWMLLALIALTLAGCGGRRVVEDEGYPDQARKAKVERREVDLRTPGAEKELAQELSGRSVVSAEEALKLSDATLGEERQAPPDPQTLDNLEKVLLKALAQASKESHPQLLRNLGILHYYKKEHHKSRQELQAANELNPRDARTHYYLACLFAAQARALESKGKSRKARAASKRAQVEIDRARQLAPNNPLYKQNLSKLRTND